MAQKALFFIFLPSIKHSLNNKYPWSSLQIWRNKYLFILPSKKTSLNILGLLRGIEEMNIFFILPSIKNFLIILVILCRFEEINISITYSTKQKKFLIHILVYKKQFLQQVKILYFCLGWVEILMTPLSIIRV